MSGASVLIMAGGTGGHVFPGLAVARELIARGVAVVWLGTTRGVEARAVPASGLPIEIEWLPVRGVRGSGVFGWLLFPFSLARAMWRAYRVFRRRRPGLVLSFGGFVAGPGGLVAWLTRTPLVIHEANAIPGFTNQWLARVATRVLSGFPGGFRDSQQVGNPVRREISALPAPAERMANRNGRLRVLVFGGSLGARVLNETLPQAIRLLPVDVRPTVRHQCGRNQSATVRGTYGELGDVMVTDFIDDMAEAYAWADVVIARAGAMTVAELSAAGCCALLVPYPYAADDHQSANARMLVARGGAMLLPQSEFTPARAAQLLRELHDDRPRVLAMARAAHDAVHASAARTVTDICQEILCA